MKGRAWISGAVVVGIVLLAPVVGSFYLNKRAEMQWAAAEKEAKAAGLPLTIDEVLKGYRPGPDSRNAAEGVKDVLRTVLKLPKTDSVEFQGGLKDEYAAITKAAVEEMDIATKARRNPRLEPLRKAMKVYAQPLKDLEDAVAKPDWNFKRKWEQGAAMLLPDLAQLKSLSKMLRAKALVAAADGDDETAAHCIGTLLLLGGHLRTEPHVINILVGISIQKIGYKAALDALKLAKPESDLRTRLLPIVGAKIAPVNWQLCWQVEQASTLAMLPQLTTSKGLHDLGFRLDDLPARKSIPSMRRTQSAIVKLLIEAHKDWGKESLSNEKSAFISKKYEARIAEEYNRYHQVFEMLSDDVHEVYQRGPSSLEDLRTARTETLRKLSGKRSPSSP